MRKIGRNDPCPCGSGKKYKKCHLPRQVATPSPQGPVLPALLAPPPDPHRFRLQGDRAEAAVEKLANRSFLRDWCFVRPKRQNGQEFCDLLVVFDDIAIIWQIKDIALNEDRTLNEKKFQKNIRQAHGAWRHLFVLREPLRLTNDRRKPEEFNPDAIRKVILISVMMGEPPRAGRMFERDEGKPLVHLFAGRDLAIVMNELDTIADFLGYMEARQGLQEKGTASVRIYGGEENLLAFYLTHGRSFSELNEHETVEIGRDGWKHVTKHPRFTARKREDRISYRWDFVIDTVHTIIGRDPTTFEPVDDVNYELLAREMARPNRLERRALAKSLHEGYSKALKMVRVGRCDHMRRLSPHPKCTFVFVYFAASVSVETRRKMLSPLMIAARSVYPAVPTVVGIAIVLVPNFVAEYGLYFKADWTESDDAEVQAMRDKFGMFRSIEETHAFEDEFPDPSDD